ncbi:class I SAM-dependent methyltransferase [Xanthomonas theicola]|uniref:LPS O-antigen biosynthesis protein n=1 Tax=Xanthomonas theicola TaxID=56464 RepID=A0A2S6ZM29_9XANT|nr:class I SAM-dependent methyltransferase [Xanthomonas theicola]PPT93170.1 LPS O-antigen biosynthesis protein [Xanthomonas theicola]QNH24877.1 class I SAM-dependent methyltransferase [Xanthomonas theicola]
MIDFTLSPSMLIAPRSVPFSAWLGHIPFASWLVEQLRPQSIVELGTHRGASFLAFCQAVQEQELTSRVFAVDSWEGDEHAGFYGEDIYNELRDYQQRNYASISEMLRMRFNEALEYFTDGSIDLLHIDGLHTYEAVREDFESWLPKLSSRGVVLFHDTCVRERGFGVWQYWAEISQQYPAFELTHTHGLGVLLVGKERSPALSALADVAAAGGLALINRLFDVLGRNVKNLEELERVYAGLADARGEVVRVSQQEQAQQQHAQQVEQQVQQLQQQVQQLQQQAQQMELQVQQKQGYVEQLERQVQQLSQGSVLSAELRRAIVEEQAQALSEVMSAVVPRLEGNVQKLDQLLRPRPWWRRLTGH